MNPRLKSRLWVEALLRRCQGQGKFGAVIAVGADDAGTVYVAINHLNNFYDLLGPPAGSTHNEAGDRLFRKVFAAPVRWQDVHDQVEKQRKFDSDIWLVEIEDRGGMACLQWIAE